MPCTSFPAELLREAAAAAAAEKAAEKDRRRAEKEKRRREKEAGTAKTRVCVCLSFWALEWVVFHWFPVGNHKEEGALKQDTHSVVPNRANYPFGFPSFGPLVVQVSKGQPCMSRSPFKENQRSLFLCLRHPKRSWANAGSEFGFQTLCVRVLLRGPFCTKRVLCQERGTPKVNRFWKPTPKRATQRSTTPTHINGFWALHTFFHAEDRRREKAEEKERRKAEEEMQKAEEQRKEEERVNAEPACRWRSFHVGELSTPVTCRQKGSCVNCFVLAFGKRVSL